MSTEASEPDSPVPPGTTQAKTATRGWRRWCRVVGTGLILGYVGICGALVYLEPMLIFPGAYQGPGKSLPSTDFQPGQERTGRVQNLRYASEDGQELVGRLLQRESPQQIILFLHGNGIHAVDLDGWTHRVAAAANATVMTAEYRGFGTDDTPNEPMVIADAYAALRALEEALDVDRSEITVFGRSLGGGIAAGLIARLMEETGETAPVRALVLDRTFNSVLEIAQDRFAFIPMGLLLRNRFDSQSALAGYEGSLIQWHGDADRIVPLEYGEALHHSMNANPKTLRILPGLAHNDALPPGFLREMLQGVVESHGGRRDGELPISD